MSSSLLWKRTPSWRRRAKFPYRRLSVAPSKISRKRQWEGCPAPLRYVDRIVWSIEEEKKRRRVEGREKEALVFATIKASGGAHSWLFPPWHPSSPLYWCLLLSSGRGGPLGGGGQSFLIVASQSLPLADRRDFKKKAMRRMPCSPPLCGPHRLEHRRRDP